MGRKALIDIVRTRISYDVFSARIIRTRDSLNTALISPKDDQAIDRRYAELFLDTYDDILKLFHSQHQTKNRKSSVQKPALLDKSVETDMVQVTPSITHWDLLEDESAVIPEDGMRGGSLSKNLESKCAYLQMENVKLQKTIEAYTTQMLKIEQDHEELLIALAAYDSELKQLKENLQLAEQKTASSIDAYDSSAGLLEASIPKDTIEEKPLAINHDNVEPTSANTRFGSAPSPSKHISHTFDV